MIESFLGKEVQKQVKQEVVDTISKCLATQDINKAIHCIWYCINTASNRVEPEEIEWIKELSKENQLTQVPIIVVLTPSTDYCCSDSTSCCFY